MMRIARAGGGASAGKHPDGLKLIDGVSVASRAGRRLEPTDAAADWDGIDQGKIRSSL